MNLLVITRPDDIHALTVATALEELGHRCVIWLMPIVAGSTVASIAYKNGEIRWIVGNHNYVPSDFDVVWLRRETRMELPNWVHPADQHFALCDNYAFYKWFWSALGGCTRWIHSRPVALRGENKLEQLQLAGSVGFNIPNTLLSNDPSEIAIFIASLEIQGCTTVYKTFTGMGWVEDGLVRPKYTSGIVVEDLHDIENVRTVPGIYQERIAKQFEIRATFFGDRELSARIESKGIATGNDDWRGMLGLHESLSATSLPLDIRDKCRALMRTMSLDVACFDFIVDLSGTYYFVELNQQGQFLWIEESVPSLAMLSSFCEFVLELGGTPRDNGSPSHDISVRSIYDCRRYLELEAALKREGIVDTAFMPRDDATLGAAPYKSSPTQAKTSST